MTITPETDQQALDRCREIREEWKQSQPDPYSAEDVKALLARWQRSPEKAECARILASAKIGQ